MTSAASPKLSIIIPCYNEEASLDALKTKLTPVLEELEKTQTVEILLVDDGSKDRTWELLQKIADATPSVRTIRHPKNRGLGAALQTGLREARGEILMTTDSDGTYAFTEIPKLLARLVPGVDIVTASPYHPLGEVENVTPYRLVLSRGASLLYRVLVNWKIHTFTSMFRAYRAEAVRDFSPRSQDFLFVTEILIKAMLKGRKVVEHPTILRGRQAGVSKARVLRIIRDHLRFQGQILLFRLRLVKAERFFN